MKCKCMLKLLSLDSQILQESNLQRVLNNLELPYKLEIFCSRMQNSACLQSEESELYNNIFPERIRNEPDILRSNFPQEVFYFSKLKSPVCSSQTNIPAPVWFTLSKYVFPSAIFTIRKLFPKSKLIFVISRPQKLLLTYLTLSG